MVNRWDAPSAVRAAVEAAGNSQNVMLADFALRLARLGHVTEVSVTVAGGPEAVQAVRSVLAELAAQTALGAVISPRMGPRPYPARHTLPARLLKRASGVREPV
jgi:hypothetical protein